MESKPKPTLEDLFSVINETLEIIQNHKGPIHLTPELLADIDKLGALLQILRRTINFYLRSWI